MKSERRTPFLLTFSTGVLLLLVLAVLFALAARGAAAEPAAGKKVYLPSVVKPRPVAAPRRASWLHLVNSYRAQANLPPVSEEPAWSDGAWKHARYMVKNNVLEHDEDTNNPWYTPEGAEAGRSSNLVASWNAGATDEAAMALWMQAPFHALGILDPTLQRSGYGSYREPDGNDDLDMGAALDVLRGRGGVPAAVTFPVAWPGDGSTVSLRAHAGGEWPDPLASCPGYTTPAGLPILLQIGPGDVTPQVSAHSLTRNGAPVEHCVFDETNYSGRDGDQQDVGRSILDGRDAIVVVPREPLTPGASYRVSITANGKTYAWSFRVSAEGAVDAEPAPEGQIR